MFKLLVIVLGVLIIIGLNFQKLKAQNGYHHLISPEIADSMMRTDTSVLVVDIRTKPEHNAGHLIGSSQSNFLGFNFSNAFSEIDKDRKIILYCQTGHRSKYAAKKLASLGFKNVYDLDGGFKQWKSIDFPIEEKKVKKKNK